MVPTLANTDPQREAAILTAATACSCGKPSNSAQASAAASGPTAPGGCIVNLLGSIWPEARRKRPCASIPFAKARNKALPCAPQPPASRHCASAKSAGSNGDSAWLGGFHMGSKSNTCIEAPLIRAACTTPVENRLPITRAGPIGTSRCASLAKMLGPGSCAPAIATAKPSKSNRRH